MPWTDVMHKWKSGTLKSGGSGKPVHSQKQAVAIMMSEKKKAHGGNPEYQASPASERLHRATTGLNR